MRTQTINIYKFDELTESAKETALENFNGMEFSWAEEWRECLNTFAKHYPVKIKDWEISLCSYSFATIETELDDETENLSGVRAWKWFLNNGYFDKKALSGECPLTGYCGDEDLLDAIRAFRDKPETGKTIKDVFQDCADNWASAYVADWEYSVSREAMTEFIEMNDYEFLENGTLA